LTNTHTFQVWNHNSTGIPHNDVFNLSLTIHQNPNLATNFSRDFRHLARHILRNERLRRQTTLIEFFETLDLIGFQAQRIPFKRRNMCLPQSWKPTISAFQPKPNRFPPDSLRQEQIPLD
jgi:hypothetical protein